MKKLVKLSVIMVMAACLVACGGAKGGSDEVAESPLALLNTIWDSYGDDERFPAAGGDFSEENNNMEGPGKYSIEDGAALDANLVFPADMTDKIDDAASLTHMMNANTFTCGVYRVKDSGDVDAVTSAIESNIQNRQWMCGFPDKLLIMTAGNYVVAAFGNNEMIDLFKTKTESVYPSMTVVCNDPIQS